MVENFFRYYDKYLGIRTSAIHSKIYTCKQRNKPLALRFFQYLIITEKTELIYSIAPQFYLEFKRYTSIQKYKKIDENLIQEISAFFKDKLTNYNIRRMYRLTVDNKLMFFKCNNVRQLTVNDKDIFLNSGEKTKDLIRKGRFFAYICKNKIVSWAEVSDIDFNGGNIVINTLPEYQNIGLGKMVVAEAAKWCLENNIVPIYWVDLLNTPSLKLAQSIGFEIMAKELVVSTKL